MLANAASTSAALTAVHHTSFSRFRDAACDSQDRYPLESDAQQPRFLSDHAGIQLTGNSSFGQYTGVSWKDAAEIKLSVASDALVIPSNQRSNFAGMHPSLRSVRSLPGQQYIPPAHPLTKDESPMIVISTLRSIWRTITSMCLSLIFTPCRR